MYTEITLGKEVITRNEFGEQSKNIVFSDTSFFCKEKSVRSTEFYQAMQNGLKVETVVVMNKYEYFDYMQTRTYRKFAKVLHPITQEFIDYTITREYMLENDDIELTLTRGIENVSA